MENAVGTDQRLDKLTEMLKDGQISAKDFERARDKLSTKKTGHWYDNRFTAFLLLIFLPPIGLYAVLRNSNYRTLTKALLISFIGLFYFQVYLTGQENTAIAVAAGYKNYSEHQEAQELGINSPKDYYTHKEQERLEAEKVAEEARRLKAIAVTAGFVDYDSYTEAKALGIHTGKAYKAHLNKVKAEYRQAAELNKDRGGQAYYYCKQYVEQNLSSPSTADFPFGDRAQQYKNQTYRASSYVDSQNGFGATIRSNWNCNIQYTGGDENSSENWKLVNLEFQ